MKQYLNLLEQIRHKGVDKGDRTGTGQREIFGPQMRFDLSEGFPLVTTKKMFLKGIIHELLWFLKGDTNIKYLNDHGVHIWDEWADEDGDLGPIYGSQWRKWKTLQVTYNDERFGEDAGLIQDVWLGQDIDQIANLIKEIKETPDSRRMIVTAWNPAEVEQQNLPPCHCMMQFNVQPSIITRPGCWFDEGTTAELITNSDDLKIHKLIVNSENDPDWGVYRGIKSKKENEGLCHHEEFFRGKLNCKLFQRSADMFLGIPFNIASYALLTMMIAQICGLVPGEFIHSIGSAHIYHNHFDQVDKQLERTSHPLSTMKINLEIKDIDDFKYEDFKLVDYVCDSVIKAPIAI